MYINSDFSDYYDFVQKMGQDPKIVYNRKEGVLLCKKLPKEVDETLFKIQQLTATLNPRKEWVNKRWEVVDGMHVYIIGGKIFIIDKDNNVRDIPEALDIMRNRVNTSKWYIHQHKPEHYIFRDGELSEFNKACGSPLLLFTESYKYMNLGVWDYKSNALKNPNLKKREFPVDPYEVYTLIFNYFQSEEPELVEVDDKYKAIAHGMDKSSFRRDKGGPTRKRKKLK